jgi:phage-related minor tail protein
MDEDETSYSVDLDAGAAIAVLDDLEDRAGRFGRALSSALTAATVDGRGLDDVLRSLGDRLADIALSAGLKPLEGMLSTAVSGLFSGLSGAVSAPAGGVTPFARGGVVAAPTYFPLDGGTGLMGEAGAEAVMPLRRGPDGVLGVATEQSAPTQIIFNVTATDATSFRKSEGQITAMLARSVARGRRGL